MFKKFSNLYLSVVWYYLAISAFGMFSHRIQETCSVTSSKENRNDLDDADVHSTTEMTTSVVEPTISDDGSTVKGRILALPTVSSQTLLVASLCFATLLVSGVHTAFSVLVGVGVLIYWTVIVFNIRRRSSSRRSEVLLVGPCGSGKTAILTTVCVPTH